MIDRRKGAEEAAADIGEGGGAAGGDAVARKEVIEVVQGVVNVLGGLEAIGLLHEREEEVGVFFESLFSGEVLSAKAGFGIGGVETALTSAGGKTVGAAERRCSGDDSEFRHGVSCDLSEL